MKMTVNYISRMCHNYKSGPRLLNKNRLNKL